MPRVYLSVVWLCCFILGGAVSKVVIVSFDGRKFVFFFIMDEVVGYVLKMFEMVFNCFDFFIILNFLLEFHLYV